MHEGGGWLLVGEHCYSHVQRWTLWARLCVCWTGGWGEPWWVGSETLLVHHPPLSSACFRSVGILDLLLEGRAWTRERHYLYLGRRNPSDLASAVILSPPRTANSSSLRICKSRPRATVISYLASAFFSSFETLKGWTSLDGAATVSFPGRIGGNFLSDHSLVIQVTCHRALAVR